MTESFLPHLHDIDEPNQNDWVDLPHDMAMCSSCGWQGPLSSCDSWKEQESWELPSEYIVYACPVCSLGEDDGEIADTWSSILALFDVAREDVAKEKDNES